MAIGTSLSDYRPMLHDYYSGERAFFRAVKKLPTLRLLAKQADWTGRDYVRPIAYEGPQNVGRDLPTLLADKANHRGRHGAWTFTPKDVYGVATLDRKTMKLSAGNARNFMTHYTSEVDGTMKSIMEDMATNLFRDESVVRSTVGAGSTFASGIIVLANRWDSIHFKQGMDIVFSDASAGGKGAVLLTAQTGRLTINTINRKTGTITVTNGVGGAAQDLTATGLENESGTGTSLAAGDYIHRSADVTAADGSKGLIGFESFILSAADRASPGTYKGVDRTKDVDRLCGLNVEATNYSMENALLEALTMAQGAGVEFSHFVCHPSRFAQLVREVDSKLIRDDEGGSTVIGRRMINVQLDSDEVKVYADPWCQADKVWGINTKDIHFKTVGKLPGFIDDDVLMLRDAGADGYEVRLGGYGEMTFSYPGTHCQIEMS